jgi:hypothetical protein
MFATAVENPAFARAAPVTVNLVLRDDIESVARFGLNVEAIDPELSIGQAVSGGNDEIQVWHFVSFLFFFLPNRYIRR